MKLLTKAHMSQRRLIEILRVIESAGTPVGARAISDCLSSRGYDLGERAVRYNLKILDELGFTKKKGYSGRVLTPLGSRELGDALVDDRIGFVNTRIEEYMFKTSFDPKAGRGDVIANTSIIDKANAEEVFEILGHAFDAGYTISRRVLILDEGESFSTLEIPNGCFGHSNALQHHSGRHAHEKRNSCSHQLRGAGRGQGKADRRFHGPHCLCRLVP